MIHLHKWGKWQRCDLNKKMWGGGELSVDGQFRTCTKCGQMQVREIR